MRVAGPPSASASSPQPAAGAATVLSRRALRYDDGASVALDRPAHVRAGSGAAVVDIPGVGRRLAIVQDDTNFIALVDVATGQTSAITLPAGAGGLRQFHRRQPMNQGTTHRHPRNEGFGEFDYLRGNKADKLDLETLVALSVDGKPALLALGSGSTDRRESVVLTTFSATGAPHVELFAAAAFYKQLARAAFTGDERNIEGAVVDGDRLRLFNRGNGAGVAKDAVGEVSLSALLRHLRDPLLHAAPRLQQVRAVDLGAVDGTRLTFTDATKHPDGRTFFLAAAEASRNTYDDGDVRGTAIGVLHDDGTITQWPLVDERGRPLRDKVEGIAIDPADPRRAFVVVDKDDAATPADLLVVQLPG